MTIYSWFVTQWQGIPAPARAFLVSGFLSINTAISAAVGTGLSLGISNGGFNDWPSFVTFASHAWFGVVIGVVFQVGPYARFFQSRAANTPTAPSPQGATP